MCKEVKSRKCVWDDNLRKDINKLDGKLEIYDNWLNKFDDYIECVDTPIIDLGCGIGNDTLYLKNKGKKVLSVDFSDESLNILKENIPDAIVKKMDIENGYSLEPNSADLILANLSLHYFSETKTFEIIDNIRNTLKYNGTLIFRVNSLEDKNYGADSNDEIERHYYRSCQINKRFFDKKDIEYFFRNWKIIYCQQKKICTKIHSNPKIVWECIVRKY